MLESLGFVDRMDSVVVDRTPPGKGSLPAALPCGIGVLPVGFEDRGKGRRQRLC